MAGARNGTANAHKGLPAAKAQRDETRPSAAPYPTRAGRIIEGDCLDVLPRLLESTTRFDLIYADPPFNAGGTRRAREKDGERQQGKAAYHDHWGGLEPFLAMLEPRLLLLRSLMSEVASLWLHLDQRAVHDAKVILDRVFGRGAFQGEVIWVPGNGAKRRNGPSMTHQTILVYSRGREMIWNDKDEMLREPYAETSLRMHFKNADEQGRYFRVRTVNGKSYQYYADEGRRLGSVWLDCPAMNANTPLNRETTGYPTQKPERLLERIIRAASLPDSHILDPMCGSGTTVVVAQRLGRAAIGVDRSPLACKIARTRLANLAASPGLGRDRIRKKARNEKS